MTLLKSILIVQIFAIPIAICINVILVARGKKKEVLPSLQDLEKYLDEYCDVTAAHSKRTCGTTCCTPNQEYINKVMNQ